MKQSGIAENRVISFYYPRHNCQGMHAKKELRRVKVNRIRDLFSEPLDPMTLALAPAVRRSRFLVEGLDLDKLSERSFYVDSMEIQEPQARYTVCDMAGNELFSSDDLEAAREFVGLWDSETVILH